MCINGKKVLDVKQYNNNFNILNILYIREK